ncbi:MAG: DUF4406 domain-containing protein [Vulcanibacillus sp.]
MIIYLSGPMTGLPNFNFHEFNRMANCLRRIGLDVINPAEIVSKDKSWEDFMRTDIKELMRADKVAVLTGWQNSMGSRLEVAIAAALNMEVIDAYTLKPIRVISVNGYKEGLNIDKIKLDTYIG